MLQMVLIFNFSFNLCVFGHFHSAVVPVVDSPTVREVPGFIGGPPRLLTSASIDAVWHAENALLTTLCDVLYEPCFARTARLTLLCCSFAGEGTFC